ncbi:MAG: hypothetical protein LBD25_00450 [Coriobacteriales bacterium]|nr:hypothetical protein [Coriobacteriales bacterium]
MRRLLMLIALQLKAQRHLLPFFALVVVFQLVLGQASAQALGERQPTLSLAVQCLSDEPPAVALVELLEATPALRIVPAAPTDDTQSVFDAHNVQGLVVVPADFAQRLDRSTLPLVQYVPAPGISNSSFGSEQVADCILQLQARTRLASALEDLGEDPALAVGLEQINLLDTVYQGPLLSAKPLTAAPVFGVSALLLLVAYLHAAMTVPTSEQRRLRVKGRGAFVAQFFAGTAANCGVWLVLVAFYSLAVAAGGGGIDLVRALGLAVIAVYSIVLAGLIALLAGRMAATWLFVPLFLLNMTVGGGLWGNVVLSPVLAPLSPVAAVVASGEGTVQGIISLVLGSCILLASSCIAIGLKYKRAPSLP